MSILILTLSLFFLAAVLAIALALWQHRRGIRSLEKLNAAILESEELLNSLRANRDTISFSSINIDELKSFIANYEDIYLQVSPENIKKIENAYRLYLRKPIVNEMDELFIDYIHKYNSDNLTDDVIESYAETDKTETDLPHYSRVNLACS